MIALQEILVPTDFSDTSANALHYARAFAELFGARLHLLHVIEEPILYGWEVYNPAAFGDEIEKNARLRLDQVLTETEQEKFRAQLTIGRGSPFVEIVRYAKDKNIDLIVLGTHGRGPIGHMLMGSVAEKVVRKAPCPVLTVRLPEHEFVMP